MIAFVATVIARLRGTRSQLIVAVEQARAASASNSAFLANMSHEIRTPLNGVVGMTHVLGSTTLDAARRNYVATIHESRRSLQALLNDILDLAKIEAEKFDIAPSDASLRHVL